MIMQEKTVTSHNDHNEPNTEGSPLPATQGFHVKLTVINSNIQSGVAEKEDPDHQDYIIWPNFNVYCEITLRWSEVMVELNAISIKLQDFSAPAFL